MNKMDSDNEDSKLVIDEADIENTETSLFPGESCSVQEGVISTENSNIAKKKIYSATIKKYSDEDINENVHPKKRRKCFNCFKCHKKFSILDGLNSHKKLHEDGKLECSECKNNCNSSEDVQNPKQFNIYNEFISSNKIKPASRSTKSEDMLESQKRKKLPPLFRIKPKPHIARSSLIDEVDYTEKNVYSMKKTDNEFKGLEKSNHKSSIYFKEIDLETSSHSKQIPTAIKSKRFVESDILMNDAHVSESEEEGDVEIISGDSGISSESGDCEPSDRLKLRDSCILGLNLKQGPVINDSLNINIIESCISSKIRKNNTYIDGVERDYKFKESSKTTTVDGNSNKHNVKKSFKAINSDNIYSDNISGMKFPHVANNIKLVAIDKLLNTNAESCSKNKEFVLSTDVIDNLGNQDPDSPLVIVLDNPTRNDDSKIYQNGCHVRENVEGGSSINNSSPSHKKSHIEKSYSKIINPMSNQVSIVKEPFQKNNINHDYNDIVKVSESQHCNVEFKNKSDSVLKYVNPISTDHRSFCGKNKQEHFKKHNKSYIINQPMLNYEQLSEKVNFVNENGVNDSSSSVYSNGSTSYKTESADNDDVPYIFMNYIIDGKSTRTRLGQIPCLPQDIQSKGISTQQNTNEQPLNLSVQNSNASSYEETEKKSLIGITNTNLNEKNENFTLSGGEIYQQNKLIYISNSDMEVKNNFIFNEELPVKDIGSPPPLYEISDTNQGYPISEIDLPPLSEINSDKRGSKKSMHRKRTPLYAQPEPEDPEERNRWHRARVTEKNRRERNKEAMRVETERDILKSHVN
ncbi:unnamed protein product, partial [Meganyctiphanes norvegica]